MKSYSKTTYRNCLEIVSQVEKLKTIKVCFIKNNVVYYETTYWRDDKMNKTTIKTLLELVNKNKIKKNTQLSILKSQL